MKILQPVFIASCLLVSNFSHSVGWAQARPSPVSATEAASVEGTVVDIATNLPILGATIFAKDQTGKTSAPQRVGPSGAYRLSLDDSKQEYVIVANAAGYEPYEERVAFTTAYSTQLFKKAIRLYRVGTKPPLHQNATTIETRATPVSTTPVTSTTPVPTAAAPLTFPAGQSSVSITSAPSGPRVTPPKTLDAKVVYTPPLVVAAPGKTTQLPAIQFVQSKAELLPGAQPALEQLTAFLKNNPTAEIELGGHTDNQGDFDENVRLSKQRVEVVKAYLVTNGIAAGRIATRGYGPTRPIGSNNAETTRQLNRRVEMTVLKQ